MKTKKVLNFHVFVGDVGVRCMVYGVWVYCVWKESYGRRWKQMLTNATSEWNVLEKVGTVSTNDRVTRYESSSQTRQF